MTNSLEALRRANPRSRPWFAEAVEAAAVATAAITATPAPTRARPRRPYGRIALAASLAAATAVAIAVVAGSSSGPGVESASAAVKKAATLTAASAEQSGTAVVRMTHDGEAWAGSTITWNGDDLSVRQDMPERAGRPGSRMLLVGGTVYGIDPEEGGWVELGPPSSIDADSGTTPAEYLAATHDDVNGTTLRRITDGMSGLTMTELADGSRVYRGTVPAAAVAPETGFKEGETIRVLPFGYVANGAAKDPSTPLDAAVTVGADGIVRSISVRWGTWTYDVAYSELGSTPAPSAPANAKPLKRG